VDLVLHDLFIEKVFVVLQLFLSMNLFFYHLLLHVAKLLDVHAILPVLVELILESSDPFLLLKLQLGLGPSCLKLGKLLLDPNHVQSVGTKKVLLVVFKHHVQTVIKHYYLLVYLVRQFNDSFFVIHFGVGLLPYILLHLVLKQLADWVLGRHTVLHAR
jgi:hypothetical protein